MRIFLSIFFVFAVVCLNAQQQKMKLMYGRVADRYSEKGIKGVLIIVDDSTYFTTTLDLGAYEISIPRRSKWLYYRHDEYEPLNIRLKPPTRRLDVRLKPYYYINPHGPATEKFAFGFLPLKLVWGALGIKLEGFIREKFSMGIYFDWYFRGRQLFGGEEYYGFKASPFVRYYFKRNEKRGFYAQASALVGYFDFEKLNYFNHNQYPYEISKRYILWTGGFGAAVGVYVVLVESRHKHTYFDMNIGFQYFPVDWPDKAKDSNGTIYDHNKTWWYFGGPGSVIEIKIAIGGIF